jgi:hypothetical protein
MKQPSVTLALWQHACSWALAVVCFCVAAPTHSNLSIRASAAAAAEAAARVLASDAATSAVESAAATWSQTGGVMLWRMLLGQRACCLWLCTMINICVTALLPWS